MSRWYCAACVVSARRDGRSDFNALHSGKHGAPAAVWIYVDTSKQVGDKDHLKVFATEDDADAWFTEHDPEGVAFEYPITKEAASLGGHA